MGQPKKPIPDVTRLSGIYRAGVLENPRPIAHRFAHSPDLREAALRAADPARVSQSRAQTLPTPEAPRFARWKRWLIAGLVSAALALSFFLGGIWLGSTDGMEPSLAQAPELQSTAPSSVLTTSTRIEAKAGDTVGFPIALDGTDGVPSRSVIAIKGLPQAINFSQGRPIGESEWMLKPDQIGDLHLVLPRSTSGEFYLAIALIGPDDEVIAEAETLLAIAAAPAPFEPVVEGSDATAALPGGEAASLEARPVVTAETTETATALSADSPPEGGEQTQETAAVPASGAHPNTLGQAETEERGLGTVRSSVYINMRDAPKSSSPVLGVIAKGVELQVLDRKRGWVQVTDPASGKKGWIYGGLLAGEANARYRMRRVSPIGADLNLEPKSESFWGKVGQWLTPG